MKKVPILCVLLLVFFATANAQTIPVKVVKSTAPSIDMPVVTSPVAGSEINGPFVLVGKGQPNATITIIVTPQYSNNSGHPVLLSASTAAYYKSQSFTARADASGKWQSPMIEVRFADKTTNRKIQVSCLQAIGISKSKVKTLQYKGPQELKMIVTTINLAKLDIKTPSNGSIIKNNGPVRGTAKAGAQVKVVIMAGYYRPGSDAPVKGPTQTLYATAGNDGNWSTSDVNFNSVKEENEKTVYTITATIDATRETKTINVTNVQEQTVAMTSFAVTSPKNAAFIGNNPYTIEGTGEPGSTVRVDLTYNGTYTYDFNAPGPFGDKHTVSNKKNAPYDSYTLTVDANGRWKTPVIHPHLEKMGPTDSEKYITQAITMMAAVHLMGSNGKFLRTINLVLTTMPMNYK